MVGGGERDVAAVGGEELVEGVAVLDVSVDRVDGVLELVVRVGGGEVQLEDKAVELGDDEGDVQGLGERVGEQHLRVDHDALDGVDAEDDAV